MNVDYEKCIECGKCTKSCVFLDKHGLNLKEYAGRLDLAYNCYLCGDCKRVCPVDIDGRALSLELRDKNIKGGENLYLKGYGPLVLEKRNYIFKNYNRAKEGVAFFPGCNFPAYYPETTKIISKKLEDMFGISTIFDCCGKPISELALRKEETSLLARLKGNLEKRGVEELILLCPNCYYYLKENSDINVSLIYDHEDVMESIIGEGKIEGLEGLLYVPCPDRDKRLIYNSIKKYINIENLEEIKEIQCCSAGGCASVREGDLSKELQQSFKGYERKIYSYCATCSGMVAKSNQNVQHILCKLLSSDEKVSQGVKSLKNRVLFSIKS